MNGRPPADQNKVADHSDFGILYLYRIAGTQLEVSPIQHSCRPSGLHEYDDGLNGYAAEESILGVSAETGE